MKTITEDWAKHTWAIKTKDGTEYSVTVHVYLRLKEDEVCDYTLDGWDTLPELRRNEHEKEIERQLLVLLEELYAQ